jgi:hypothetical protein
MGGRNLGADAAERLVFLHQDHAVGLFAPNQGSVSSSSGRIERRSTTSASMSWLFRKVFGRLEAGHDRALRAR